MNVVIVTVHPVWHVLVPGTVTVARYGFVESAEVGSSEAFQITANMLHIGVEETYRSLETFLERPPAIRDAVGIDTDDDEDRPAERTRVHRGETLCADDITLATTSVARSRLDRS